MNSRSDVGAVRPNHRWPRARRAAVFLATLLLTLGAGWRLLPMFVPTAAVQSYRVRAKVQLPAAANLPQQAEAIRAEMTKPAAVEDALAAAGIESHEAGTGPSAAVCEQLEIETRPANSGFDLLVSLPQVAKLDAPAAAVVVNRLVESWLAAHARARINAAVQAHDAAQSRLDQARRQLAETAAQYDVADKSNRFRRGIRWIPIPSRMSPNKLRSRYGPISSVAWPSCARNARQCSRLEPASIPK